MNKQNKHSLFAAVTAAIFMSLAATAHAELRIGGQLGFFETDAKKTCNRLLEFAKACDPADNAEAGASDAGFGVFAQYRRTLPSGLQTGTHVGYAKDSSDFPALGIQTGAVFDLLGLLAFPAGDYTPIVMFGYSTIKTDDAAMKSGADAALEFAETTLPGWKFAFGAEFEFTDEVILHALWQYADYSAKAILFSDTSVTQTSLRFGISLRF